jgi:hypothetical protein
MKSFYSFILFLFLFNVSKSQERKTVLIKTPLVEQYGGTSCWAASTQMLVNSFQNFTDIQCDLFCKSYFNADTNCFNGVSNYLPYCKQPARLRNKTRQFGYFISDLKQYFTNYDCLVKIDKDNTFLQDSLRNWQRNLGSTKYTIAKKDSIGWSILKQSFQQTRSPICHWKYFDSALQTNDFHINIFSGFEHTKFNKQQMRWLFVNDSWPGTDEAIKGSGGAKYIITYEFYKKETPELLKQPPSAVFYNLSYSGNSSTISALDSTAHWSETDTTFYNVVKNVKRDSKALNQAQSLLNHITASSSDSLLNFVNLKRNNIAIDQNNALMLVSLTPINYDVNHSFITYNGKFQKVSKTIIDIFSKSKTLLTLFDTDTTMLVPVKNTSSNELLTVMSFKKTKKKQWYTSRLETYTKSILEVVKKSVEKSGKKVNKVKAVYVSSQNIYSKDYLIIEFEQKNEPSLLVDLFSKMDDFKNADDSLQIGFYNTKIHQLSVAKQEQLIQYFSPATKICETCKISEAGKAFIKSYGDLVKRATKFSIDTLRTNETDCPYYCQEFTAPSSDFNKNISNGTKISFLSSFNIFNTAHINSFFTPLIDSSRVRTDPNDATKTIPKYIQQYSSNCSNCYVSPTFTYPKYGYNDSSFVQIIIFIPISIYKTYKDKKFDDTDFEYLQNFAINPQEMTSIGDPFLEANDGYLSVTNSTLKKNCNDTKSITGVVCNVKVKSGETIQCYVFNKESFGTSNPYLNWKVKRP